MARTAHALILLLALALTGCNRPPATAAGERSSAPAAAAPSLNHERTASPARHDLSVDESMGGHTLARHVGRTDAELIERLRREPQISSASTYTDRETAEEVITAALESPGRPFLAWRQRTGRRPNFVLRYAANRTIGRSMSRGRTEPAPCRFALIVLRWDDRRSRFYVLTSYPEEHR